jgi:hypothetical protein
MTATMWIWSEVDAVVTNVELFPDLTTASVLGDDGGLGSDLGPQGLDLGFDVFLLLKINFLYQSMTIKTKNNFFITQVNIHH